MAVNFISIITASFNDASGLNKLAQQLRTEQRALFQWIVIDGGSTDNTGEIAQTHADLIDVFVSEPDQGVYDAWNKGLALANGTWILFLGCDDRLAKGWLEEVAQAPTDCDLVYGDLILLSQDHQKFRTKRFPEWSTAKDLLVKRMCLPQSGMAHHRRLFSDQNFNASYRICGDWEFLIRAKPKKGVHLPSQIQTIMALGGLSSNAQSEWRMYREILRIQHQHQIAITWGWRLKFYIRICLSCLPSLYNKAQQLGMRAWQGAS